MAEVIDEATERPESARGVATEKIKGWDEDKASTFVDKVPPA